MKSKIFINLRIVIIVLAVLVLIMIFFYNQMLKIFFSPTKSNIPQGISGSEKSIPIDLDNTKKEIQPDIAVIAANLEIPWEIVFLPDGELLTTVRSGKILRINPEIQVIAQISGVAHVGEGGLLGMAVDPNFSANNYIYLYLTYKENGTLQNKVERYELVNNVLQNRTVILSGIKGAANHDGGRLEFGPDGMLYITTGDGQQPDLAQDTNSLNGKILRINFDGSIPSDNPFGNAVYSYGHRNPQGLAWDSQGRLWATEHGPSGSETGNDEVNLIIKGGNYGWPLIRGVQTRAGMITPVVESGLSETWAPAGLEIIEDTLYFGGLRGEALYSAQINGNNLTNLQRHFQSEFGRIRAVKLGPDGFLYVSTSNRDGRGDVNQGDDKIIRINPKILN